MHSLKLIPCVKALAAALAVVTFSQSYAAEPINAPESPAPAAASSQCDVLFTADDQRLFEFIKTRREIDFSAYAGKRIRHIEYVTLPIFNEQDDKENNWLYRAANWIHIPTKASPIEQKLLIAEGDPVQRDRIRESERILRDSPYLYDAMILPATDCGDELDLLVIVRDVWTLQLAGSFSRTGGDNSSSIGIAEGNIMGYGHAVYLSYDRNPERSGVAVGFATDHLFDGHTQLVMEHIENDDGNANAFVLERPFYSVDTPWATGVAYRTNNLREEIETANVTSNEYDHHTELAEVYVGLLTRLEDQVAHHWRLGFTSDRDSYDDQDEAYSEPLPKDRTVAYPWIEFETIEYNYWTTSNLNQLFRNEDINLGTLFSIRLGSTSEGLGSTEEYWVSKLAWQKTTGFGSHHVLRNKAYGELYFDEEERQLEHSFWGWQSQYDYFIDDLNRWHIGLQFDAGYNLDPEETLTAGGIVLRGFENATQRGNRFALFQVEHRHFFDVHPFHLFRLGSAVFFEAGRAWDTRDTFAQSDSVLYDVGLGLRINSSKARPNHIFHINIAVPLNERDVTDKYQISFYTSETF